jgi:hypothetical protein
VISHEVGKPGRRNCLKGGSGGGMILKFILKNGAPGYELQLLGSK